MTRATTASQKNNQRSDERRPALLLGTETLPDFLDLRESYDGDKENEPLRFDAVVFSPDESPIQASHFGQICE
ncbi:hypothetical protein COO72_06375 [Bifidobacterium callitrichos]|nr:hypothetical protein COO72_06375 [Bifidobacterium callitrichos]